MTNTDKNDFNATISNTVLPAVFFDGNGNELKKGDKVIMTLYGLGSGEMDIVEHENDLIQMFNKGTNAEFCTSPAILQNTCYSQLF